MEERPSGAAEDLTGPRYRFVLGMAEAELEDLARMRRRCCFCRDTAVAAAEVALSREQCAAIGTSGRSRTVAVFGVCLRHGLMPDLEARLADLVAGQVRRRGLKIYDLGDLVFDPAGTRRRGV